AVEARDGRGVGGGFGQVAEVEAADVADGDDRHPAVDLTGERVAGDAGPGVADEVGEAVVVPVDVKRDRLGGALGDARGEALFGGDGRDHVVDPRLPRLRRRE